MSSITKVALAGATGKLGPSVLKALIDAGFDVTVLSRQNSLQNAPPGIKVTQVDYSSQQSLVSALIGKDALISCLPNHGDQPLLIDAAIAAGVKRYIPSEFGSNVIGNKHTASLPVFAGKVRTEKYLVRKSHEITWTVIVTGGFLDWGIQTGLWANLKSPLRIYGSGNETPSFTLLSDIGKAVVGVLKHPDETMNRAVYVQSVATSQNKILELAQKANPFINPIIEKIDLNKLLEESYANLQVGGSNTRQGMVGFILVSTFDPRYGGIWFSSNDNALLGIQELSETGLFNVISQYV